MKVLFIGASQFGLRCLQELNKLTNTSIDLVGVVTAPQNFSISYRPQGVVNVLHADVSDYCKSLNIPYAVISNGMNDEDLFCKISSLKPDIFLVVGWYHMIPKKWMELAPAYGLHASLLPDYSGGAPLVWSIINGENKTGITFFKFDSGVDSGPIVGQLSTPIFETDTIATLYERIEELGLDLIRNHLPLLANGSAKLYIQDESKRRIFSQRSPEDGLIDWTMSAQEIYNFIRAQTRPYPGAFTYIDGKKITIWSSVISKPSLVKYKLGEIVLGESNISVVCGDGQTLTISDISGNDSLLSPKI